jgi:endonuclease/exonuclease/phosphatase family metal-dependent hydrolase
MILAASYNIRKAICADRRRRPDRILEVLAEIDADVIALQECDRRFGARTSAIPASMLAEYSDYKPVPFDIRHGSMGWHGNAVLVKKDVEILRFQPLVLPALEPRGAVVADVEVRGMPLRIVGMHLDLSGLWRRKQVRDLLAQVEALPDRLPTVMMGDLNEWRDAQGCLRDFAERHRVLPTGPSFHAKRPLARLDRIIVSDDVEVDEVGVHHSAKARIGSDHLPVWARLAPRDAIRLA